MLELPGQRRARFFNTRPPLSPPLFLFRLSGLVVCCAVGPFFLLPALFVFLFVSPCRFFLLFFPFGVLESSDQGRVRILNTSLLPPLFFSTAKSVAQEFIE